MTHWRAISEVARWEFRRYVKPKQQLVGMIVTFVIFGGFMAVGSLGDDEDDARNVALIGGERLPVAEMPSATVRFTPHAPAEEADLRRRVSERELDGMLIVHDDERAELVLRRSAPWTAEIELMMSAARQQAVLARAGLGPADRQALLAPPTLDVRLTETAEGGGRGERIAVVIVVSLMLMTVFIGMSYVFASITGEKQIRVTEQVISAIPAQAWIDGKILGLMAVSVVGVAAQVLAFLAVYALMRTAFGADPLPVLSTLGDPGVLALIVLFGVLGLCLWFAFLGAVAATIDDPHNSTRGSLLFLPVFATGMAFFVLANPDSLASRIFALLPPTAPSAMPVRVLMSEASSGEVLLSIALLAGTILLLRIAAGRIFRTAMLMYGKEPSWTELRRWATKKA